MMSQVTPSWMTRFLAIVRYEMLWNIRKKMFIGALVFAFLFATLGLVLPAAFGVGQNPDFAVTFSVGNIVFVLFAIVTGMHCLSGEYEKGTIVPLLTKPVSRTMVFLGKLFAIFIVLLSTYTVIYLYTIIGGIIVYGPQNSLYLVPLELLGDLISTFIWVGVVLAAGALSKSTLLTILTTLGLFVGLFLGVSIAAQFTDAPGALNYIPGSGATGTLDISAGQNMTISNMTINTIASTSTGTDAIGINLAKAAMYPDANVDFYYTDYMALLDPAAATEPRFLYSESMGLVAGRSVGMAFLYTGALLAVALFAFKRWQVAE